jgi:hypothetical protein
MGNLVKKVFHICFKRITLRRQIKVIRDENN